MDKVTCFYCESKMNPTSLATNYGLIRGHKCPVCDFEFCWNASHGKNSDVTLYFPDEEKLKIALQKKGV